MSTRFQLDSLLPSSRRCARLTWLLLLAACSSSEPGPSVDSDQTGGRQDSGDGDSHSGGDQGTGGALSQDRGAGGRTFPDVEPSTCAETTISPQPLPLDMFIVLDRTGSMGEDCTLQLDGPPQVDSMWCKAVSALAQYFTSAEAAGHRAALQFMIPAATQSTECGTASTNLHTQAEVDLTQLPEASNGPLILALEAQVPDATSTALESALNGIVV